MMIVMLVDMRGNGGRGEVVKTYKCGNNVSMLKSYNTETTTHALTALCLCKGDANTLPCVDKLHARCISLLTEQVTSSKPSFDIVQQKS
jgi:hypothetical protein